MGTVVRVFLASVLISTGCWAQASGSAQPNHGEQQQTAVSDSQQPQSKTHLRLTAVETIPAKSEVATGFADLTCDEDGNLYLGLADPGATAIRKLNAKGELAAVFKPYANPDIEVYGAGSYTISPDGDLYMWVGSRRDRVFYVLVFGADGNYKTKIKVDPGFPWVPASVAVFRNGNLLMTGQEYDRDVGRPMLPFTAIFRSDGKLLKEVTLEDDTHIHEMAKVRDPKVTSAADPTSNRAVAWGQVQSAKDGYIYVMRWLSPALFYVISPGGEVVRRFTVDPGSAGSMPITMHISGNRIAVLFRESGSNQKQMKVVDLNGEELATYDVAPSDPKTESATLGSAFTCYSMRPERFTFLVTDEDHRIQLRIAEPR